MVGANESYISQEAMVSLPDLGTILKENSFSYEGHSQKKKRRFIDASYLKGPYHPGFLTDHILDKKQLEHISEKQKEIIGNIFKGLFSHLMDSEEPSEKFGELECSVKENEKWYECSLKNGQKPSKDYVYFTDVSREEIYAICKISREKDEKVYPLLPIRMVALNNPQMYIIMCDVFMIKEDNKDQEELMQLLQKNFEKKI